MTDLYVLSIMNLLINIILLFGIVRIVFILQHTEEGSYVDQRGACANGDIVGGDKPPKLHHTTRT